MFEDNLTKCRYREFLTKLFYISFRKKTMLPAIFKEKLDIENSNTYK